MIWSGTPKRYLTTKLTKEKRGDMEWYDMKWNAQKKSNNFELTKEKRGEATDEFDQGNWPKSDRLHLVSIDIWFGLVFGFNWYLHIFTICYGWQY